jgi:hypothetical protein
MVEGALNAIVLLVLVFVPALSFLGLFRLIDYVADDELVARVENGEFQSGSPAKRERAVRQQQSGEVRRSDTDGTRCRECGLDNWDGATYCRNCLQELA